MHILDFPIQCIIYILKYSMRKTAILNDFSVRDKDVKRNEGMMCGAFSSVASYLQRARTWSCNESERLGCLIQQHR